MAKLNPEDNYITQSLSDRLEKLQKNLDPGNPTFMNFFSDSYNKKNLKYAQNIMELGRAAQEKSIEVYQEAYDKLEKKMEDMIESRPYLRKEILGAVSEVKKGAEMALNRSFKNQEAYANSVSQRNMGAAVTSTLAKTKEQQKQKVAASTAMEMAREKMARRQMYNQVVNRQNTVMQSALGQLRQLSQSQMGIGLSGLQTGMGGMLGAGSAIHGLGQAQGSWSLLQQEQRFGLDKSALDSMTKFGAGQIDMKAQLEAARREDKFAREQQRDSVMGAIFGGIGAVGGSIIGGGFGTKKGAAAGAKASEAINAIFGGG